MAISLGGWEGAIGIFVLIAFAAFWIMNAKTKSAEESGTSEEKNLTSTVGLDSFERYFKGAVNFFKRGKKEEKKVEGEEKEASAASKKKGASKGKKKANKAGVEAAKTAETETRAEKATAALEGRGVGLLAAIEAVVIAVKNYLAREKPSILREEKDIEFIEKLTERLDGISGSKSINSNVAAYLKQLFVSIEQVVNRVLGEEENKKTHHTKLIDFLKSVMKEARGVIGGATIALADLTVAQMRKRKYFGKESRIILKAIETMEKEQTDGGAIKGSKAKLQLLRRQHKLLGDLIAQFHRTDGAINKVIIEIKALLRKISGKEKQTDSFEKAIATKGQILEKRFGEVKESADELKANNEKFGVGTNPRVMANQFSRKIRMFDNKYKAVISQDVAFDGKIHDILVRNTTLAFYLIAYEQLSIMLDQGEKAVDQGLMAADNIVSTIVDGQDQRKNLRELTKDIGKAGGRINFEARLEQTLQRITKDVEHKSKEVSDQVMDLVEEDKRLAKEIEEAMRESSTAIGSVMGNTAHYMPGDAGFEQRLERSNPIAAQEYRGPAADMKFQRQKVVEDLKKRNRGEERQKQEALKV